MYIRVTTSTHVINERNRLNRYDQEDGRRGGNAEKCGEHRHLAAQDEAHGRVPRGGAGEAEDGESRAAERAGPRARGQARHVLAQQGAAVRLDDALPSAAGRGQVDQRGHVVIVVVIVVTGAVVAIGDTTTTTPPERRRHRRDHHFVVVPRRRSSDAPPAKELRADSRAADRDGSSDGGGRPIAHRRSKDHVAHSCCDTELRYSKTRQ